MSFVYGSGMIGSYLKKINKSNYVIIAQGVSNSNESNEHEFNRDFHNINQIISKHNDQRILYLSSFMNDELHRLNPYFNHKKKIEKLLLSKHRNTMVLRLPQVVGVVNNTTLVSNLVRALYLAEQVTVFQNATRVLLDVEDLYRVINKIIKECKFSEGIFNISPSYSMGISEIVNILKGSLSSKSEIIFVDKGNVIEANDSFLKTILSNSDQLFQKDYGPKVLSKYSRLLADKYSLEWRALQ